ncbi:hypothetical protein VQ042_25180 [Aurantimonas sp. A2-1-M11]|uniref:hypothetical protein n=1 Tax=Aurantimonas sp. A2-1-M11 TaxID=3113712 RepID=UPI002F943E71
MLTIARITHLNARYEMGPYIWHVPADRHDFLTFLFNVADLMPFARRFAMEDEEFAIRIYVATDGLVGRVMRLAAKATAIAADRLANGLTMADFANAFDATKKHGVTANPFRGSVGKVPSAPQNLMDDRPDEEDEQASHDEGPQDWQDVQADADLEDGVGLEDEEGETRELEEGLRETKVNPGGPDHGVDAGSDQFGEPDSRPEVAEEQGNRIWKFL